ncbi:MAG TPA: alpha/beta hydrolase domain-containing protein [Acidimicrobiia bacterium]|nr:alpha/beta hydrolase domain-containing protein [Acidimicrobiia bacterium]
MPLWAAALTAALSMGVVDVDPGRAGGPAPGLGDPGTSADVANPTVEGPITGGIHGHPWYDPAFEVGSQGYVEEEYFLSGVARSHPAGTSAAYKTRILVIRPASPLRFNGTVVVEWDNVTAQAAFSPMFAWAHPLLLRDGYAFVSVSAQAAGVCCSPLSHFVWDPLRYGSLIHPEDVYSFDIYSQAIESLVHPSPPPEDPLGGLVVNKVIAVGQSQSANRLHTYVNEVHNAVDLIDGFIIDAGGSKNFPTPPSDPVIHFLSEDGITAAAPDRMGHPNYRLWEAPAASHNDADTARHIDGGQAQRNAIPGWPQFPYSEDERLHAEGLHYGEEGPSTYAGCQVLGEGGNEYPRRYAVQAALDHMNRWVTDGVAAPQPPRVQFTGSTIARDDFGHPLGGVRLPPIDVPVARYFATTCALFGHTVALDPATLLELYPTHADYVSAMQAATDAAVGAGFMLAEDGEELMGMAEASAIPFGLWAP